MNKNEKIYYENFKDAVDRNRKKIKEIKQLTEIKPVVNQKKDQILGSVIYIDNYGNVITNITKKIFNEIGKSRPFTIEARRVKFKKIFSSYSQAIDFTIKRKKREEDGKVLNFTRYKVGEGV